MSTRRLVSALFAICMSFVSLVARADGGSSVRFASTVGLGALRASACSMKPSVVIDGQTRPIDVMVEGRRCESAPAASASAIPLAIHMEAGETRHVVLEMNAPAAFDGSLREIAGMLAARVAITMALALPTPPRDAGFPTPSAQDLPRFDAHAWHRRAHHDRGAHAAAIVIPVVLGTIAVVVLGAVLLSASGGMSLPINGW